MATCVALNTLIRKVIIKQNATLYDPWGEILLYLCISANVGVCGEACKCSGHIFTTSKYKTCDKNTFIQKGLDRLEEKAGGNLVEFSTANIKSCSWDGITLQSSTAVTRALKSLEITKISLSKD